MRPSKDPQPALGTVLRALREERKVTQRAIAIRADLSFAQYSAIETGKANPLWGTMKRIAKALGVTVAEISRREEALSDE